MNRYSFNKEAHRHELDGKPLYGITSVLGVIAKPALIQWSANMACDYIKENGVIVEVGKGLLEVSEQVLKEARTAHTKKKEKAGDWGTKVHEQVEWMVKEAILNREGLPTQSFIKDDGLYLPSANQFYQWAIDNKVRFLESEKHLYSEKHWIGGICDLVYEVDGKRFIGDIKTSSGIYPEMFLQCAGYEIMLEEMGEKIDGYEIINLKKDGTIQTARSYGTDRNKQAFLSALNLFKSLEELKKENGNNKNYTNK